MAVGRMIVVLSCFVLALINGVEGAVPIDPLVEKCATDCVGKGDFVCFANCVTRTNTRIDLCRTKCVEAKASCEKKCAADESLMLKEIELKCPGCIALNLAGSMNSVLETIRRDLEKCEKGCVSVETDCLSKCV